MAYFAVFVPSAPSPPPTGQLAQQGCAYSVPVDPNNSRPTYQCLTEEQYNAKKEAEAQQATLQAQQTARWWGDHWHHVVIGIPVGLITLFVVGVIFAMVADSIERRRHPERFDVLGFRRDDPFF